jgi:hypothetical protein
MPNLVNELNQLSSSNNDIIDSQNADDVIDNFIEFKYNNTVTTTKEPDYELHRPCFGYLSDEITK